MTANVKVHKEAPPPFPLFNNILIVITNSMLKRRNRNFLYFYTDFYLLLYCCNFNAYFQQQAF